MSYLLFVWYRTNDLSNCSHVRRQSRTKVKPIFFLTWKLTTYVKLLQQLLCVWDKYRGEAGKALANVRLNRNLYAELVN